MITTVANAATTTIYSYNNPPPLLPSNPATTVTVNVSAAPLTRIEFSTRNPILEPGDTVYVP